jgi:hypothetical protein
VIHGNCSFHNTISYQFKINKYQVLKYSVPWNELVKGMYVKCWLKNVDVSRITAFWDIVLCSLVDSTHL